MKFSRRLSDQAIAVSLILGLLSVRPAYAYIDPGSGSYIVQLAIAFLVGAFFTLKMFGKKIVALFMNIFSSKKENGHDPL